MKIFFKSSAREDLFTNALVSVFTSYKNFTSFAFNLGRMCWKQISSFFTIKLHTSLSPIRLFCFLVVTPEVMTFVSRHQLLLFFFFFLSKSFYYNGEMISFSSKKKNCRFLIPRERKRREKTDVFYVKTTNVPSKNR